MKRNIFIAYLFLVVSHFLFSMQQKEIIPNASFFAIADKNIVTEYRTYMSEIRKTSKDHHIYKKLCDEQSTKIAFEKQNKKAIVFLNRNEEVIHYILTDNSQQKLLHYAQQKLDPKVKPLVVRGVIGYHVAIGRALFLYDKDNRCLCLGEYKGSAIQLSENARKIFGQYVDLRALQEIKTMETKPNYVMFLSERLKKLNVPG